uniref:Sulfotransferase domain-containing protein n=1 Tax=viral metagenome TaxID=1070528 RepID=A0A6C0KYE2_9ZZZZ
MYIHLNLLGPYNSGTNIINNLLIKSFNDEIKYEGTIHIWKHSINLKDIEKSIKNNKDTLFVVVYRPLYSWFKSMEKEKYDIIWDKKIDSEITFSKIKFKNIIELYEEYYRMYKYLIETYENVICLEYYKICDINISYNYITQKVKPFNIDLLDTDSYNKILNTRSKKHGYPVNNSQEALDKKKILDEEQQEDFPINYDIVNFYEEEI